MRYSNSENGLTTKRYRVVTLKVIVKAGVDISKLWILDSKSQKKIYKKNLWQIE